MREYCTQNGLLKKLTELLGLKLMPWMARLEWLGVSEDETRH